MDGEPRGGGGTTRGNLPAPAAPIIGRDHELAEAVALVRANRLTTLTGVGGVGKTRLAVEVAAAVAPEFPDGVWFVELAPVLDSSSVAHAIGAAMGIAPRAGLPLLQHIAELVSERKVLVVLDNCEHVIDAGADAAEAIIARRGPATVLATSREGLRVDGERLMPVRPLDLEGGPTSSAVTLFVQRAQAVRPDFRIDEAAAADAVTQICRGLDGLALPIELAAARMISMTPVDLERRLLADRFRMLTGSSRRRSLHQSVGWSFDLLDDEERVVLRHASVFAGGFDVDAITAVVGATDPLDVLDRLDSLVRKSLVIVDEVAGRARYRLLETIRQFGENELSALDVLDDARDRHVAHFVTEVAARWDRWNGPGFRDAVDWVSIELANLRTAFRWSVARDDIASAAALAAHGAMIGTPAELFEILGWVEEILDGAVAADVAILPRVYAAAGYRCFTGFPEEAVTHARAAVRLQSDARYEPFEPGLASFIEALAQVYAGHLDRYVEITSRLATLTGDARAYGLPAFVDGLQATGRVDEALDLVDEAVTAARGRQNPFWIAYALWIRGSVYARVDPTRALEAWREAIEYVHAEDVQFFEGFIARDAASVGLDADPDEALTMFDVAIESFSGSGNVAQLLITLASVTLLFERLDRPEAAATLSGAMTRQPAGDRHVPGLSDASARLGTALTSDRFDALLATGAALDLSGAADFARAEIRLARADLTTPSTPRSSPGGLSRRQIEVLRLLAEGLTTREIAEQLYISAKTADHHIQHIYTKIGVSNRPAAALWASGHGLLD